ncbi:hypothetical protein ACLK1S_01035 [Escherichia coli]
MLASISLVVAGGGCAVWWPSLVCFWRPQWKSCDVDDGDCFLVFRSVFIVSSSAAIAGFCLSSGPHRCAVSRFAPTSARCWGGNELPSIVVGYGLEPDRSENSTGMDVQQWRIPDQQRPSPLEGGM